MRLSALSLACLMKLMLFVQLLRERVLTGHRVRVGVPGHTQLTGITILNEGTNICLGESGEWCLHYTTYFILPLNLKGPVLQDCSTGSLRCAHSSGTPGIHGACGPRAHGVALALRGVQL